MRGVTTAVLVCGGFLAGCFVSQLELAQSLRVVPALDPSAGAHFLSTRAIPRDVGNFEYALQDKPPSPLYPKAFI